MRCLDLQPGKLFGHMGADLNTILSQCDHDTIIEMPVFSMNSCSPQALKILFENYRVLLSDTYVSGMGFLDVPEVSVHNNKTKTDLKVSGIVDFLKFYNINPRKIYTLGVFNNSHGPKELNFEQLSINIWPLVLILTVPDLLPLGSDQKQERINQIEKNNKMFATCLNRKPRLERIKMLDALDKKKVLENIDWTLGYKKPMKDIKYDLMHSRIENNADHLGDFLKKYAKHLPKLYDLQNPTLAPGAYISATGKYHWDIVTETCSTDICGVRHITEKSFKSMYAGSMPIINGHRYIEQTIRNKGFWLPENSYDHLEGEARISAIADYVSDVYENNITHTDQCIENFLHATELDWIISQVIEPFKILNS